MSTIEQDIYKVRHAIYGKEVREAIADGLEKTGEVVQDIQQDYGSIPSEVETISSSFEPITNHNKYSTTVASETNFNSLTTPGSYIVPSQAIATSLQNCPSAIAGRLTVFQVYTGSPVIQEYVDASGSRYIRAYISGVFDPWRYITKRNIQVSENANFDSYRTPGYYIVNTSSIARTITNCPSKYNGILNVRNVNMSSNTGATLQEYIDAENKIYHRAYVRSNWSEWRNDSIDYGDLLDVEEVIMTSGYITNNTSTVDINNIVITDNPNYQSSVVQCNAGDLFLVLGEGAGAARLWAFFDSSGHNLYMAMDTYSTSQAYIVVEAPANSAVAIFNVKTSVEYSICRIKTEIAPSEIGIDTLAPSDMDYGFVSVNGTYSKRFDRIMTREHVSEYMISFTVVGSSIEAIVIVWKKDGTFWNQNTPLGFGKSFVFDHSRFDYDIILRNSSNDVIGDWSEALSEIKFVVDKKMYAEYVRGLKDKNYESEEYIKNIANSISTFRKNSSYNISYANALRPLQFKNYTGDTQQMHPSVKYFSNGFGGHKFWMAYTPYTLGNAYVENPCIAYSDDGIEWTNIEGNPLDRPSDNGYYSDTELIYNNTTGLLECWYRYVSDPLVQPRDEIIYRRTSSDGVTWSAKQQLHSESNAYASFLMSHTVIIENSKYCIWAVGNNRIRYFEAPISNPTQWTEVRTLSLSFGSKNGVNFVPWHISAIKDGQNYVLCVMIRTGMTAADDWRLSLAISTDNINYSTIYNVIVGSDGWDKYIYRSSIVKVDDRYRIYYTGLNGNNSSQVSQGAYWHMGITESSTLQNFIGLVY